MRSLSREPLGGFAPRGRADGDGIGEILILENSPSGGALDSSFRSTAYFIVGVLPVDMPLPRNWGYSSIHSRLAVTESLLSTLFCGAALYGIHERTVTAWRLGWVYLGAAYIWWVFQGLSLMRTVP